MVCPLNEAGIDTIAFEFLDMDGIAWQHDIVCCAMEEQSGHGDRLSLG